MKFCFLAAIYVTSASVALAAAGTGVVNVQAAGAKGDGVADDTLAINRAVEQCAAQGGGTVSFPAGTYLCGSIHLRSWVRLDLAKDATLKAAPSGQRSYDVPEANPWEKYQDFGHSHFHCALIWGEKLEHVAISGGGTINGAGLTTGTPAAGDGDRLLSFRECSDVAISDLTLMRGGHFALLATGCDRLTCRNLQIRTARDGLDIVGCQNVVVSGCDVRCLRYGNLGEVSGPQALGGDDAIVLKSDWSLGRRIDCAHVLIEDCRIATACNAFQIGSETVGDFTDIRVHNLVVDEADKAGIGLVTWDGGKIDGVLVENVRMRHAAVPIYIAVGSRLRTPFQNGAGSIRHLTLRNITSTESFGPIKRTGSASVISGLADHPVEGILLEHVQLTGAGGGQAGEAALAPPYPTDYAPRAIGRLPAYGLFCRNLRGLTLRNVDFGLEQADLRPALKLSNCERVTIAKLVVTAPARAQQAIMAEKVTELTLEDCSPAQRDQLRLVDQPAKFIDAFSPTP